MSKVKHPNSSKINFLRCEIKQFILQYFYIFDPLVISCNSKVTLTITVTLISTVTVTMTTVLTVVTDVTVAVMVTMTVTLSLTLTVTLKVI